MAEGSLTFWGGVKVNPKRLNPDCENLSNMFRFSAESIQLVSDETSVKTYGSLRNPLSHRTSVSHVLTG